MDDKQETTNSSSMQIMWDKYLNEINRRCETFMGIYKRVLQEKKGILLEEQKAIFQDLDFKLYCAKMMWRAIPDKLLYPAIDKWVKALEKEIDPLDIFLLGWYTGDVIRRLDTKLMASIRGRLHRTGNRTEKKEVDPRFRKVYDRYKLSNNQMTLNQLLQCEFHIKDISKPNAELTRFRSKFYRAKWILDREGYPEDISNDPMVLEDQYLDYLIRHSFIQFYNPDDGSVAITSINEKGNSRTIFDVFTHEKANKELSMNAFAKMMKNSLKKQRPLDKKEQGRYPNENDDGMTGEGLSQ
jgi:hypothetical protein